jgi:hypothetical protein
MNDLVRNYPLLEKELFQLLDIITEAGFDYHYENGMLCVFPSEGTIEYDEAEGLVIINDDYRDEFEKRQNEFNMIED